MEWLNNLTAIGRRLDCHLVQVNYDEKAARSIFFYSKGVTRFGAIKTPLRKECLSPSRKAPLKEGKVKAVRPDVNNTRDVRRRAKTPFILKGGPDHLDPCRKGIIFPSKKAVLRGAFYAVILRSKAPDLKANVDRVPRCHSTKRSEGYYSENNNATGVCNIAFESLGKTELEPKISPIFNGGNRIKRQPKVDLKNCLIFNPTC